MLQLNVTHRHITIYKKTCITSQIFHISCCSHCNIQYQTSIRITYQIWSSWELGSKVPLVISIDAYLFDSILSFLLVDRLNYVIQNNRSFKNYKTGINQK